MHKRVFLSVLMLLLIGGCGDGSKPTEAELEHQALSQKIRLVEASGGYVLIVGGETLTSDEIIESPVESEGMFVSPIEHFKPIAQASELEQFKKRARDQLKEIVSAKISNILLYQLAKRQAGKNIDQALDKQAEKALREFVVAFGGDQIKADEALKQRGMDWTSFREYQKRLILTQWYLGTKFSDNRPVTYRELMDCYNEMKDKYFAKPGIVQFRLIDIHPARLELTDPNEDRYQAAEKLAIELARRIRSGEDFGELAKQYSHGLMREFGGLWRPVQPGSLAPPYDMLAAEAWNTEPGQIAHLIITPGHIFILKLEEKKSAGYEPFEKVQEQVRNKIILDRRNEAADRVNATLLQQAELSDTDEFTDFCLEKIYQMRDQPVTVRRDVYRRTDVEKPRDTKSSIYRDIMPGGIRRR
ncbi:MAG: peptidylprolyl isomerase [Sedimentisphaerales bacterium]